MGYVKKVLRPEYVCSNCDEPLKFDKRLLGNRRSK